MVKCEQCGTKNRVDPRAASELVATCGKCGTKLDLEKQQPGETKPVLVTDANFQSQILDAGGTVLLDCWAPWCGPCRMITPIMEELATESNGRYRIGKLNVDENPRTAAQFQIQSIPTMLIFKNGQLVDKIIGAVPKPEIIRHLLAHA
ncbi:MAG TPA: thioredoxin [Pyrinomonadaceae bacterium]|nr:thioredoxin [Pyrinomonadaceae bacterium]